MQGKCQYRLSCWHCLGEALQKGQRHAVTEGSPLRAASLPTSPFWGGFAKGEMSRSDRGVPLRAASLSTSPFRGGFAKKAMSHSDRGVTPPSSFAAHLSNQEGFTKTKTAGYIGWMSLLFFVHISNCVIRRQCKSFLISKIQKFLSRCSRWSDVP